MHLQGRLVVVGMIGLQRADNAQIIDAFRDVREQARDLDAASAVRLEGPVRLLEEARVVAGPPLPFVDGDGLAVVAEQGRLGVEGVDVRNAARHEEEDDVLGARREVRRLRRQQITRPERKRPVLGPRQIGEDAGEK